jgi:hypothetical protein
MRFRSDDQRKAVFAKLFSFSKASNMIEEMKKFKSSKYAPSPIFVTNNQNYDLAAVIAGTKPAAIIEWDNTDEQKELLTKAAENGLYLEYFPQYDKKTGELVSNSLIVGEYDNVKKIIGLHEAEVDERFHRELGNALGYDKDSIDEFIDSIDNDYPYAIKAKYVRHLKVE